MKVPHPIPYQGSKRGIANSIIEFFPKDVVMLYEPFAGSAAVTIAAASYGLAEGYVLNDLNRPLMKLWEEMIHRPNKLSDAYEDLWKQQMGNERDFYLHIRDEFNKTHCPDYFLYLLARCVKGAVRYNSQGDFNQSPDNRRKGAHPDRMRDNVLGVSRLLHGKTQVFSTDFEGICMEANQEDLIYMDPPYQGVSKKRDPRYFERLSVERFVEVLENLNMQGLSYIVSYDGRTGDKSYGDALPKHLGLACFEIQAGRSSQATLLGKNSETVESLYLSPALVRRLGGLDVIRESQLSQRQLSLIE